MITPKVSLRSFCLLLAMAVSVLYLPAAGKTEPETPLTEAGNKLLARYSDLLQASQAEVAKALPKLDEQKKAALQKARDALKAAEAVACNSSTMNG